jgi:hypothetical protein
MCRCRAVLYLTAFLVLASPVAADSKNVAAGEPGPAVYLWRPGGDPRARLRMPRKQWEALTHWEALRSDDAAKAFRAVTALAGDPESSLPLLKDQAGKAEGLRAVRAVEVLHAIGTPEARAILEDLARGKGEAGGEAATALQLLPRR